MASVALPRGRTGAHLLGDADAVAPAEVARHLKEHVCPLARLTLMPGVGHFCQLSEPDLWLASVAAFYKEDCGLSGAAEEVT
jgi:pimeloyl-ACP methyl ester carboxylesterase